MGGAFLQDPPARSTAIAGGKVKAKGERVKPAREVAPGDELAIRIGEFEWLITVKTLCAQRGPAEAARHLYAEDEASRARRMAQVDERRAHKNVWAGRKGRPTKRDRRQLERLSLNDEG